MSIFPEMTRVENPGTEGKKPIVPVLRTYAFDFDAGDFVLRPGGKPSIIEGEAALIQNVKKALMTDRYTFPIYSSDYGNELKTLIRGDGTREWKQAEAKRLVREAVEYLFGVERCEKFSFRWSGNTLQIFFLLIVEDGTVEMVIDV
ncbi:MULTISPECIES: DUF2634 domain-containing protein [Brevibacillus]|jgi:hypothetical protein|uniref:DUF2634 domain-containing protein n=1 Tax=Brevibacillus TaxID=55080 RepID=UPI000F08B07D|nr:DUF2634 domain-containing protein [Brevibacillus borstelensis]MED1883078.1 DUF2634 domain-containing protein [Brevibacillus borstelensis]MED2008683.1 DUF2634 domain-containing protein [Brevibacillus borstelensis]RNB55926.1 DUF2634 domain-containing protein [Brevibacillus borstelensis]GED54924.1 hypothetical protein BBO01nite_41650 [Brevibacillus borstelensis]